MIDELGLAGKLSDSLCWAFAIGVKYVVGGWRVGLPVPMSSSGYASNVIHMQPRSYTCDESLLHKLC